MKPRNREINIFNLSMLDVISGALGAFLIIMVVLFPYYKRDFIQENSDLRSGLDSLQVVLGTQRDAAAACAAKNDSLQALIPALAARLEDLEKQNNSLQVAIDSLARIPQPSPPRIVVKNTRKLYVIDVSGSMAFKDTIHGKETVRIEQVRAGVKMAVATLDANHMVDILFYPNRARDSDYGYLWGRLRQVADSRKDEVFDFLWSLTADGPTPTGPVLDFVLSHPGYSDVETVLFLSDGVPTDDTDELTDQELRDLVVRITAQNRGRKKINTIGIGKVFRDRNSADKAVWFMRELARRNRGFFMNF